MVKMFVLKTITFPLAFYDFLLTQTMIKISFTFLGVVTTKKPFQEMTLRRAWGELPESSKLSES